MKTAALWYKIQYKYMDVIKTSKILLLPYNLGNILCNGEKFLKKKSFKKKICLKSLLWTMSREIV